MRQDGGSRERIPLKLRCCVTCGSNVTSPPNHVRQLIPTGVPLYLQCTLQSRPPRKTAFARNSEPVVQERQSLLA